MPTSGQDGMVSRTTVVPIADPDPYSAIEGLQTNIDAAGVQVVHDPINIVVVAFRLVGHVSVPFPCARNARQRRKLRSVEAYSSFLAPVSPMPQSMLRRRAGSGRAHPADLPGSHSRFTASGWNARLAPKTGGNMPP